MKWKKALFMVVNKVPKEIQPKVKAFLGSVEKYFSFLKDYNYVFNEAKIATEYVVDNIIEVSYKNEKLDRLIVINYEPNDIDNNVVDLVTVSLFSDIRLRNKELVLKKYLKKYKSDLEIEHLTYPSQNGKRSFEENMKTSISGYAYFLKDIGINLVKGTEWEDGLIYDWSAAEDILYKTQKNIIYGDDNTDDDDDT